MAWFESQLHMYVYHHIKYVLYCLGYLFVFQLGSKAQLTGDIDACEIFAGTAALTEALRAQGFVVACADIEMGQCFDITSCAGFLPLDKRCSQQVKNI